MSIAKRWPFLVLAISSVLIVTALLGIFRKKPSTISVATNPSIQRQSNDNAHEDTSTQRLINNYIRGRGPRSKPTPLAKLNDEKPLRFLERTNDPNALIKPDSKNKTLKWESFERIMPGYSTRQLDDETAEFLAPDGKIYRVGAGEVFLVSNGIPRVAKSGVPYCEGRYSLLLGGMKIPIDQETAYWLRDEYDRLAMAVNDAPDEKTRAWYFAEYERLYREFGAVSISESITIAGTNSDS